MNEWISSSELLPPRGVYVEMCHGNPLYIGAIYREATVKGFFRKKWCYKSGLHTCSITESDYWRPLIKKAKKDEDDNPSSGSK